MLGRAMARRCPVCGKGKLFRGGLRLAPACPECGWITEREPGTSTGPMYLSAAVTQIVAAALALGFLLLTDWPASKMLLVGILPLALFCLWCFPLCKAVWAAVEYFTDAAMGETGDARYAREAFSKKEAPGGGGESL